ncbi:MAG: hypothetical protein HKM04_11005 [Legionellales bacterium]|nr:hypothetical protein [Legionellales bacterium]
MEQKLLGVADVENYLPILFAEIRNLKQGKSISLDEITKLKINANRLLIHFLTKGVGSVDNWFFEAKKERIEEKLVLV